jgi:hypothetical protein
MQFSWNDCKRNRLVTDAIRVLEFDGQFGRHLKSLLCILVKGFRSCLCEF